MLKKALSLVAISGLFLATACKENAAPKITEEDMKVVAEEAALAEKMPKVQLNKMEHDFGTITEGAVVETEFMVTNLGESDLIISNASASCGCTVPDYPKQPLKPGETAPIKVSFNSAGKSGMQNKTVTLTTNTENGKETFSIKANVEKK